ncbi:MAG: hypothetical protein ABIZ34_03135 [Candidatus Limnocylindrales bacterium]
MTAVMTAIVSARVARIARACINRSPSFQVRSNHRVSGEDARLCTARQPGNGVNGAATRMLA